MKLTVPIEAKDNRVLFLRTAWVTAEDETTAIEASVSGRSLIFTVTPKHLPGRTYVLRAEDLIRAVLALDEEREDAEISAHVDSLEDEVPL